MHKNNYIGTQRVAHGLTFYPHTHILTFYPHTQAHAPVVVIVAGAIIGLNEPRKKVADQL